MERERNEAEGVLKTSKKTRVSLDPLRPLGSSPLKWGQCSGYAERILLTQIYPSNDKTHEMD